MTKTRVKDGKRVARGRVKWPRPTMAYVRSELQAMQPYVENLRRYFVDADQPIAAAICMTLADTMQSIDATEDHLPPPPVRGGRDHQLADEAVRSAARAASHARSTLDALRAARRAIDPSAALEVWDDPDFLTWTRRRQLPRLVEPGASTFAELIASAMWWATEAAAFAGAAGAHALKATKQSEKNRRHRNDPWHEEADRLAADSTLNVTRIQEHIAGVHPVSPHTVKNRVIAYRRARGIKFVRKRRPPEP